MGLFSRINYNVDVVEASKIIKKEEEEYRKQVDKDTKTCPCTCHTNPDYNGKEDYVKNHGKDMGCYQKCECDCHRYHLNGIENDIMMDYRIV